MRLSRALVLTSVPGRAGLTAATAQGAHAALDPGAVLDHGWLAEREAWQALFTAEAETGCAAVRARVAAGLGEAAVDVNVVPDDIVYRRKRLLVADMESTIIEQEMLDELGDFIGKRAHIEDITARAMRGELDFEAALKERVGLLAGLDASVLDQVAQRITLMPGAGELVRTMQRHGAYCALVSGGFTVFTERVARKLGFDEHRANVLEIAGGKLTGRVREPILGRQAKLGTLEEIAQRRGLDLVHTLAVGDGANDLAMIERAGLGVAFRAKPKVREAALATEGGAVVTHGDLTALLYLQGYRRSDFAA